MAKEQRPTYQITRTEKYIQKNHELTKTFPRLKELNKAVEWALSRKPHHFTPVTDEYYVLVTQQLENPEFPEVRILYLINQEEQRITLLDIDEK